jgi:hypothetical protein
MVDSLNPSAATLALALAGNGALDGKKAPEAGNGVDVPSPPAASDRSSARSLMGSLPAVLTPRANV